MLPHRPLVALLRPPGACRPVGAVLAALIALVVFGGCASLRAKGSVDLETRAFWEDDDPSTKDYGLAVTGRLEARHKHRPWREELRLLGRAAAVDPSRSVVIVQEAFAGYRNSWLKLRVGPQILNWTATEAFHPADVMNSRNLDGNVENPDKIGEPMVMASLKLFRGRFELFYMPFRMNPIIPSTSSRLGFGISRATLGDLGLPDTITRVSLGQPFWGSRGGEVDDAVVEHQWAARISQTIGGADVAVQVLQHNNRAQPVVLASFDDDTLRVRPLYNLVTHIGLTYTHVIESVVLKVEAAHRRFSEPDAPPAGYIAFTPLALPDHTQIALGFEYGWSFESGIDATLILEGQGQIVHGDEDFEGLLTPFQRDILAGLRLDFNDIDSKALTVSGIFDLERTEILFNIAYSQRLTDTWSVSGGLRLIRAPAPADGQFPTGLQGQDGAHHLYMTLKRHF